MKIKPMIVNSILAPSPRRLLGLMALVSAALLGGALLGQFGLGWHPCDLCLYQRYPYVAVLVLVCLALVVKKHYRGVAWLCVGLFALDAAIAFYHTGVELEWFAGPDGCSAKSGAGLTIEELRAQLLDAPLVSCKQAMAYVFGLSLAAWNVIIATSVALWAACVLRRGVHAD